MKNVFFLILLLFVPIAIFAQTEDDENLYNDSTEFFLKYQMIVDTAKVEAIAKAYKEKRKAGLAPQIDRLAKDLQGLKAITCLDAKEKLSAEDGTLEVYTQLLNELKEVDVTKPVSVSIDDYGNTSRAVLFMHNMDVKKVHIAGLKWIDQYVREKEKAEKQLKKKQLRNSTIMCYVNWVYEKTEREFYNLKSKMEDYDSKYFDAFHWYRECEGTDKYPQKQISVKVDNKNYRPKLFRDDSLDKLDLRLQKRGWEWADSKEKKRHEELDKLDELIKARFAELFGDCRLNPKGWNTVALGDIADVGSSKRVFVEELKKTGIPFYRGTEVGALAEGKTVTPELFITEEHYIIMCGH